MKIGTLLAILFLALVTVGHLLRILMQLELVAGGYTIPMWVSIPPIILPTGIAYLLWRESRA